MEHSLQRALAVSTLFQGCDIDASLFSLRRYSRRQMIDDTLHGVACVGLVVSGQVDVYSVAVDGRDVRLNTLHIGECFGIHNLLADADMQTVLHCGAETSIGYISKATLLLRMETDQRLSLQYAKLCNEKIQFLLRRIELLTMQTCRGKLISYLLAQRSYDDRVDLSCSREELARHLGMSRATLFRELSILQRKGLLLSHDGALIVPNAEALEQFLFQSSA